MKVSILMSVYNGEDYLQDAIESILNQSFSDFEFIIINDYSTDNTWSILQQNAERDQRIVLVNNSENLGLTRSLNKGLRLAKGDYIARQDADDISLPQRLEKEVNVLDQHLDCVLVSCNLQLIKGNSQEIFEVTNLNCNPELVCWYLLFYNHIAGHSQVMYRRDVVLEVGGYSEDWSYIEDYELWCRFFKTGKKLIILPEILLTYRRHPQSITATKVQEQESAVTRLIQLNIKYLTKKQIHGDEARMLLGFWKSTLKNSSGATHHRFPDGSKAELIHQQLTEIKQGFVREYKPIFGSDLDNQIRKVISQQFLAWLQSPLTSRHSIWSKIQISRYAFQWNPLNVPRGWFIWFLRFPFDTTVSIFRKL